MRFVDPHRVTAMEVAARIKEVVGKMAKEKKELKAGLEAQLAQLRAEKAAHDESARKREWYLTLAGFGLSFIVWWDDTWGRFELVAVGRILRRQVSALDPEMYVSRPEEDGRIATLIGVPSLEYDVVVGPRGCGKSSLVLHVASEHRGVATFSVASESDNAYVRIAEAFGIGAKHYILKDHHQLVRLLQKASKWHARLDAWGLFPASINKWVPTIIVEIDHRAGQDTIAAIAKQLKIVASDNKAARVILVLSDANAQFALPGDHARQEVIWVDDLTEAEARAVMEKHNFAATEEEKQLIFRRAGTRVADLVRLIGNVQKKKVPSVEAAVNAQVADAKDTIGKLLELQFKPDDTNKIEFKKIFDALLKSPSCVPAASFSGATRIPESCGEHFKKFHAFSYYNPDKKYVFYSPAHFEAAKELRAEHKY